MPTDSLKNKFLIIHSIKETPTLANHKSALKRARQNEIRRIRNRSAKTRIKSAVKEVQSAPDDPAAETGGMSLDEAKSIIDKAAKRRVIHPKTAARKISRLTKALNARTA